MKVIFSFLVAKDSRDSRRQVAWRGKNALLSTISIFAKPALLSVSLDTGCMQGLKIIDCKLCCKGHVVSAVINWLKGERGLRTHYTARAATYDSLRSYSALLEQFTWEAKKMVVFWKLGLYYLTTPLSIQPCTIASNLLSSLFDLELLRFFGDS